MTGRTSSTHAEGWDALANIMDDGEHVAFTHVCSDAVYGNEQPMTVLPLGPWRVISKSPLTVEPSVSCDLCGFHGFITNGHIHQLPGSIMNRAKSNVGIRARLEMTGWKASADWPTFQEQLSAPARTPSNN